MMLQNRGRDRARTAVEVVSARLLVLAVAVVVAACATVSTDSSPEKKKAEVTKRVEARWAALLKGDVSKSYALLSPTSKSVLTEEQYRERIRTKSITKMDIDSVDCSPDACKVRIWITFDAEPVKGHPIKGIRTTATETWVIDRGEYWYVWPTEH
jgi:hypothetical protein